MDMPPLGIDIGLLFNMFLWFSCGWFLVYVILGSWFKVRLVNLRMGTDLQKNKRLVPVFISHLLFSLVLVNPFVLLVVTLIGENISGSRIWGVVLFVIYLGLLPIILECLLLRFVSRWKRLKWLQWKPSLKRVVLVSLVLSMVSFSAGYGAIHLRSAAPAIVTTFHYYVRGKGYINVDTPGVGIHLCGGWFDEATVTSDVGLAKVNARIYSPEYIFIEAKQNDAIWRIDSSGPWGKLENIKVKNKETTRLELGPPFLIKTAVSESDSSVLVNLLITGRAGEHYKAAVTKNGKTIASPGLKIVDEAGNLLASDKFRYG